MSSEYEKPIIHGRDHRIGGADPIPRQGGRMPWILFEGNLNGQTVPSGSDYYPALDSLYTSPLAAGGTVDSAVYGGIDAGDAQVDLMTGGVSNEPFKAVEILQPGLYMFEVGLGWYLNWGAVRVNYDITSTDGVPFSHIAFRAFVHDTANSYFGGASDGTAPQIAVADRTVIAVDERATDVHVRGLIHNFSGSSRTYGTDLPTNVGAFSLFLIQLSSTSHSNP